MNLPNKNPWYRAGLAFKCLQCGNCCAGPQEGYVWISNPEITALAHFLKITTDQLKQKYLRRVRLRYSLIEKQPTKDCIFLTRNPDHTGTCLVYPVRPLQCRTWPFWKENLRSPSAWRRAAAHCPGMDRGRWYDYQQIEAIRSGDLSRPSPTFNLDETAVKWIINNLRHLDCIQAVHRIYREIDLRLEAVGASCENCGRCCDFDRFGHRLYATTLEMLYFLQGLYPQLTDADSPALMPMVNGRCPFQQNHTCRMRPYRPASCRIFYCKDLDPAFQNEITEQALLLLRRLHEKFHAVYYYADLAQWLAKIAAATPQIMLHPPK